ncbi:MAG: hypothetical protein Tsb0021_02690 [Chlamydiales bacterium]
MDHVDIFQIRFPRLTQKEAIKLLLSKLNKNNSTAVYILDMSAINQTFHDSKLKKIYQNQAITLNDGAALSFAAWLQGKPFPDNLNGTDLTPKLLQEVPDSTSVFVLGSYPEVLERACEVLSREFPHVNFSGHHHGYFNASEEKQVVEMIRCQQPDIVLVGMGNPRQAEFIHRHKNDEQLKGILWIAIGGMLHYYGGNLKRAPTWMRRWKLEWLSILLQQPHKFSRYIIGIPLFITRCLWAQWINNTERNK